MLMKNKIVQVTSSDTDTCWVTLRMWEGKQLSVNINYAKWLQGFFPGGALAHMTSPRVYGSFIESQVIKEPDFVDSVSPLDQVDFYINTGSIGFDPTLTFMSFKYTSVSKRSVALMRNCMDADTLVNFSKDPGLYILPWVFNNTLGLYQLASTDVITPNTVSNLQPMAFGLINKQ